MPVLSALITQNSELKIPRSGTSADSWIGILVLTTFDDDEYRVKCLEKRTLIEQIVMAIRSVHLGYRQRDPTIAPKVFSRAPVVGCLVPIN